MTGDREVPILVRLCRNLLLTEAGLLLLGAAYLLLARGVSGNAATVEGGLGIGTEAVIFLVLAVVVVVLGINVGRLVPWARWSALALQAVLIGYLLSQAVRGRGSSPIALLLAVVIVGLLLSPQANRGFATPQPEVSAGPSPRGGPVSEASPGESAPAPLAPHAPGDDAATETVRSPSGS